MRLLHLIQRYWPVRGGAEAHLQAVSERLASDGHEVTVATTNVHDLAGFTRGGGSIVGEHETERHGVRILRFPIKQAPFPKISIRVLRRLTVEVSRRELGSLSLLRRLSESTLQAPALNRWLNTQAGRFDIIAAMGIGYESLYWPAAEFAVRTGVPFFCYPLTHLGEDYSSYRDRPASTPRGKPALSDYYTMRQQVELLRTSSVIFAQTSIEVDYLAGAGISPERIVLAGAGVAPDEVTGGSEERFRESAGIQSPFVLALGTHSADKGTLVLIEAMQRIWERKFEASLVLAGSVQPEVTRALHVLPAACRARIHQLGAIDDQSRRDALAACALLALPSRSDSFGIVLLEAWLNDKPVIGARAGGLPAVIDEGRDGLLTPFGDAPALADALAQLLGNARLRSEFGRTGRAKVLARYTWDTIYPRIREAYERFGTATA